MSHSEELLEQTSNMDTQTFLRFLIKDRFPQRILATCSLRARSLVLLKLISDIDETTPIIFCHAQSPFPESLEFRAKLISQLNLQDVRYPSDDEGGPLPGDRHHSEGLWAENPADQTRAYTIVDLNQSLAESDCWISGVYHGPYSDAPGPRVSEDGRLIKIDPLAEWTQDQVRSFMQDNDLHYHPRSPLRSRATADDDSSTGVPTYHF